MWPMIGSLVSAGSSLLGGILGQNNQEKINEENIANQRDFAQHGLSWKVADAKAAGLNPLAALGAQTSSFQNVVGSNDLAQGVQNMGQNLGRAVEQAGSGEDRAFITAQRAQVLQRGELENQLLASQLRVHNQVGDPRAPFTSGANMPGQTSSGIQVDPSKTVTTGANAGTEAAVPPMVQLSRSPDGGVFPIPTKAASYASFGSHLSPFIWDWNNNILPMVGTNMTPPGPPDPGKEWQFRPWSGYRQVDKYRFSTGVAAGIRSMIPDYLDRLYY